MENFDTCYKCGKPGHFARNCPRPGVDPPRRQRPSWQPVPVRDREEQARINERGMALVRASLAGRAQFQAPAGEPVRVGTVLGIDPEQITSPGHRCHHCADFTYITSLLEDLVAGQASIDAAVAAINDSVTSLTADVAAIEAKLAAGTVNTDALDAALPPLAAAVNAVNALAQ